VLDVLSFQGELCYGAISGGYVESQIWEATDLQERGVHRAELLKTIVHQHRQLVHRQHNGVNTRQIALWYLCGLFHKIMTPRAG